MVTMNFLCAAYGGSGVLPLEGVGILATKTWQL